MIQAAARGIIDFREARPLDRSWWLRCRWLMDGLENQHFADLCYAMQQHHLAAADLNRNSSAGPQNAWQSATSRLTDIARHKLPWFSLVERTPAAVVDEAAQEWKKRFGDPNDPVVKERIRQTIERWKAGKKGKGKRKRGKPVKPGQVLTGGR